MSITSKAKTDDITIDINVNIHLTLWSAIKLRIAGKPVIEYALKLIEKPKIYGEGL